VRELHNAVARHLALGEDATFEPLPGQEQATYATREDFVEAMVRAGKPLPIARQEVIQAFDQRYVQRMLELHGGNVSRAATAAGIGRRYFQMIKARR
jgi:DNA-binding NtrC family response regulator